MKLFKVLFISTIVLLTANISLAQHHRHHHECKKHRDVIKAERVAYITKELDLSVKEAQNFWPIYNEYNKTLEDLRDEKRNVIYKMNDDKKDLSEKEYQNILNKYFAFVDKEYNLKKKYHKDLSRVLSAKKIYLLYNAEKAFKRKLVKDLRGKKPACMK